MSEFEDALRFGEPLVAYYLLYQMQNPDKPIDWSVVHRMRDEDSLGINSIKLYSFKEGLAFHLVLADSADSAKKEILKYTTARVVNVHDISHGMDQVLWDEERNKSTYIRKEKIEAIHFPHYIGIMERGD